MKAYAKCPKCGKIITTDCEACIEAGIYVSEDVKNNDGTPHKCNIKKKIKWKKVPETEEELREIEEI